MAPKLHFLQKEFALGLGDPRFLEKRPAASIFTKMVLIIHLLNINPETLIFECYIKSIKSFLRVTIILDSELSKPLFEPVQGIASSAVACLKENKIILNN